MLKQEKLHWDPREKEDISLVFSFTASQPQNEAEYLIYQKWAIAEGTGTECKNLMSLPNESHHKKDHI
jgi:hypothetical protein